MLSDLLKWGKRSPGASDPGDIRPPKGGDQVVPTKAFPKFLSAVSNQADPTIVIDLGPVIGGNVAFLGERLGCKLFIEDLVTELDRHMKAGTLDAVPAALAARLGRDDASVDGVLCWDLFDFLPKTAAQTVAKEIVRILKPGGAVMGFFSSAAVPRAPFTKFEIVDEQNLRHKHHPGAGGPKQPHQNRDILKMFDGLAVAESFLLKNNTREILLRKKTS
jgi:predicted SAM-dependent methyltransferase